MPPVAMPQYQQAVALVNTQLTPLLAKKSLSLVHERLTKNKWGA
jgi:hypothetical protein